MEQSSLRTRAIRFGAIAIACIAAVVLALLVIIVWTIANRPVRTTSELVAEAQLLVAGTSILISAVLAGTTIYYARWTRNLVIETRQARIADQADRDSAARRRTHQQLVAATVALVGSASDVIALKSVLAQLLRRRRIWRTRRAELAMQPVIAASRALDHMRYAAPADVIEAAGHLFDLVVEYYRDASAGLPDERLVQVAQQMSEAKAVLNRLVLSGVA